MKENPITELFAKQFENLTTLDEIKNSPKIYDELTTLPDLPKRRKIKEIVTINKSVNELIKGKLKETEDLGGDDAFYIADMGELVRQLNNWKTLLPRIEPFFGIFFFFF